MITIWKYELEITDVQEIECPLVDCLTVQMQNGKLCLWCLVDTEERKSIIELRIYGTGNPTASWTGLYIGSVQDREFVWHVWKASSRNP